MMMVVGFCALLALNVWFFLVRPVCPWTERLGALLQIVGFYTFTFGVLAQAGFFSTLDGLDRDMTSPDFFEFIRGNLRALVFFLAVVAEVANPDKLSYSPLHLLEFFVLLAATPFLLAYIVLHFLVVMPLSYIAYVVVSVPIEAISSSPPHLEFESDGLTTTVKELMAPNSIAIKNFLIAFPAVGLALALRLSKVFRHTQLLPSPLLSAVRRLLSHRWLVGVLFGAIQVFTGILFLLLAVSAITALTLRATDLSEHPIKVGEVIGVEITIVLALCALVALFLKIRNLQKSFAAE